MDYGGAGGVWGDVPMVDRLVSSIRITTKVYAASAAQPMVAERWHDE